MIERYLKDPCRTLSIPYWKHKTIKTPSNIMIIHNDEFYNQYSNYQRFFRIKHDLKTITKVVNEVEPVDIENDKELLIEMINKCYKHEQIIVNKEDIDKWISNPTFNKSLWVKIIKNNEIIASGIAEYDQEINEGILEWIQVLPEYQKQGYGKDIVNALLKQLKNLNTKFVTVSGNYDNNTNPLKLYRNCGFEGNDIWYICVVNSN